MYDILKGCPVAVGIDVSMGVHRRFDLHPFAPGRGHPSVL